jgi:hypothetical protein
MLLFVLAQAACASPGAGGDESPAPDGVAEPRAPASAGAGPTKLDAARPVGHLAGLREDLRQRFDRWLEDPARYRKTVRAECGRFPEGDLFPYTFPAMAYASLALANPSETQRSLERMAPLLDQAIAATTARTGGRPLLTLRDYRRHGVYIGQLNLALASWSVIGGDDRYLALHRHLSRLLADALEANEGRPIRSFPGYSWTFDTVPALASVVAFENTSGDARRSRALIEAHRRWEGTSGTEPDTGLPWSRVSPDGTRGLAPPRGCDLSWRIALLASFDRERAEALYRRYVEAFWLDRGVASGFAEWPEGSSSRADLDSGPVLWGIGSAATGLGLATIIAMGDEDRLAAVSSQVETSRLLLPLILSRDARTGRQQLGGMIDYDPAYLTGFLYGDATLFYASTWHEWPSDRR